MITIATWNKCNNNCLMCTNPPDYKKESGYGYKDLAERYGRRLDSDEKEIYLTGGEPTIHPHFFDFLDFLEKKCPESKITIVTNGRLFHSLSFARKCLARKNISFQIAVHGPTSRLHDKITGIKGSFEQTIRGIKNIISLKPDESEVELRIVIHKLTFSFLKDIHHFLIKTFPEAERVVFIFMEMEGMAGLNIKKVGIEYKDALPYLEDLLPKIKESAMEARLYHFPLCVLPFEFWPYVWRTLPPEEIIYLPACEKCYYKNYCLGIHKLYPKYMTSREFHPPRPKNLIIKTGDNFHHPILSIKI